MTKPIVILGASRGPGRVLYDRLRDSGRQILGLARSPRDIGESETAKFIECDAEDIDSLAGLTPTSATFIHCSRPEHLTAYLQTSPAIDRLIAIGSTRVYTRFPDDKCARLAAMSHEIWMRDIPSTILHPTMIYGATGFNNIERIFNIARLSPWLPLPDNGSALIQPVHVLDVSKAIEAALKNDSTIGKTLVVAGKEAMTYRQFVELCIRTAGTRCNVISLPYTLVAIMALLTSLIPGIPTISQDEIRRLLEDKNFDTSEIEALLGDSPMAIEDGLKLIA